MNRNRRKARGVHRWHKLSSKQINFELLTGNCIFVSTARLLPIWNTTCIDCSTTHPICTISR